MLNKNRILKEGQFTIFRIKQINIRQISHHVKKINYQKTHFTQVFFLFLPKTNTSLNLRKQLLFLSFGNYNYKCSTTKNRRLLLLLLIFEIHKREQQKKKIIFCYLICVYVDFLVNHDRTNKSKSRTTKV